MPYRIAVSYIDFHNRMPRMYDEGRDIHRKLTAGRTGSRYRLRYECLVSCMSYWPWSLYVLLSICQRYHRQMVTSAGTLAQT
ncbi:hypothetical protein J6590_034085 [Homalodisca vitripennis]|nr:hypothetical protein J6590_034085 [Homalodisca vitripennis]